MWVKNNHNQDFEIRYNNRYIKINKGVNEISEDVAKAFFLYGIIDDPVINIEEKKLAIRHALYRWGKTRHDVLFLDDFIVAPSMNELKQLENLDESSKANNVRVVTEDTFKVINKKKETNGNA